MIHLTGLVYDLSKNGNSWPNDFCVMFGQNFRFIFTYIDGLLFNIKQILQMNITCNWQACQIYLCEPVKYVKLSFMHHKEQMVNPQLTKAR